MRNALIGAFVLSVMMAPLAAHGTLEINVDGSCRVLDETGTELFVAIGDADTTLKVKTNGTTLGTCRFDFDFADHLLDTVEFRLDDGGLPPGNPNFCTDHPDHEKCATP